MALLYACANKLHDDQQPKSIMRKKVDEESKIRQKINI